MPLPVLAAPAGAREPVRDDRYWRALELELLGDPVGPLISRREFTRLLGASMALAGVTGCVDPPRGERLPYARQPPGIVPGVPLSYATSLDVDGCAIGLLVQTREGRPIKVEGNPAHPASLGATGVMEQAALLDLYDATRARSIRGEGRARAWTEVHDRFRDVDGTGLRFLLPPTSSPFRLHLLDLILERHPGARVHWDTPAPLDAIAEGARMAFGRRLVPVFDLRAATRVVLLDADPLAQGPYHVRHARDFAGARSIDSPADAMNRLYAAEPVPTPSGSIADHRLRVRAARIGTIAAALHEGLSGAGGGDVQLSERERAWVRAAAADLTGAGSSGLVIAGAAQPPHVHALAFAMNLRLGAIGTTVRMIEPPVRDLGAPDAGLDALAADMHAGVVETLVVLDGDPLATAPPALGFAEALARVGTTVHASLHENATARAAEWFLSLAHPFETWGDARAWDGTLGIVQPLIAPLWNGVSIEQSLLPFAFDEPRGVHSTLRAFWRDSVHPSLAGESSFEEFWRETLRAGLVEGSAASTVSVQAAGDPAAAALAVIRAADAASPAPQDDALEIVLRPHPLLRDGRSASNAWLQELPDPVTRLTWGNAALLAPATADRLGIADGDPVAVEPEPGEGVVLRALRVPGHAEDAVTLHLGLGRDGHAGTDVFPLLPARAVTVLPSVRVTRLPATDLPPLAIAQRHQDPHDREIALHRTLEAYRQDPGFTRSHRGPQPTLYQGPDSPSEHEWAMSIDLSLCTGCSACVVACQAENNIPVVGPEGVRRSRNMHWLRIDRYVSGDPDDPVVVHQPMACQHCEKAPCEYVCPVNATVHSSDGLNEMIYNRCIGTRYCSNNCPYKVRRFNWFDYNEPRSDVERLVLNPDVTVRARGVMEKCTYCVQRIRRGAREARNAGRALRDGEIMTACQQACPTRAIRFGSLTAEDAEVVRMREQPRAYFVLHELGTRPRTAYLARITNPHPSLGEGAGTGAA